MRGAEQLKDLIPILFLESVGTTRSSESWEHNRVLLMVKIQRKVPSDVNVDDFYIAYCYVECHIREIRLWLAKTPGSKKGFQGEVLLQLLLKTGA